MFIYQQKDWPAFFWDKVKVLEKLAEVKSTQGYLLGRMSKLGFELQNQAFLEVVSENIQKSSEIEGEGLNMGQIRSSIARRLKFDDQSQLNVSRNVEGAVDIMLDALDNFEKDITKERLFGWHAALFPTGYSGMYKIGVGKFRSDEHGAMQIVSGYLGSEKVHYDAPAASNLEREMDSFLQYANSNSGEIDNLIKAAIIHLWFVILHPFEDGNGRIARALSEIFLKRSDRSDIRFYSMSSELMRVRKEYYEILEITQKGSLDITDWIVWFLSTLKIAMQNSEGLLNKVCEISEFWAKHSKLEFNARQKKILSMLLNDFKGNLTSSKWAKICKCSQDTATRDISDLLFKNILRKEGEARASHYILVEDLRY